MTVVLTLTLTPIDLLENIDWRVSLFRILSCFVDALLSTLVSVLFNNQGVGVRLRDKDRGTG